jgi:IrrE N-terminal-like domain
VSTEALERLAAQVLAAAGLSPEPPVPLETLAAALGVESILRRPMVEEGRLEQRAGRTTIFLREGTIGARQRFTLAHELGHLVLADPEEDLVARRMWSRPDREERFCDEFAAAILLPREWILRNLNGAPENLRVARELASRAEASLSASVVRLRELLGWERSLLHWRRYEDQWRLTSTAGLPRAVHNRLTSEPATRAVLDALRGSGEERHGSLPLAIGGVGARVPVEISVGRQSAVALATFSRIEAP